MKKQITVILTIIALAVALSLTITYAWFASIWQSKDSIIKFNIAGTGRLPVTVWTYSGSAWEAFGETSAEDTPEKYPMKALEITDNNGTLSIELASLQMGMVDNLVSYKESNAVYIRVAMGAQRTAEINMAYENVKVYAIAAENESSIQLSEVSGIDLSEFKLLQYEYCLSANEMTPADDTIWASTPADAEKQLKFENPPVAFGGEPSAEVSDAAEGTDMYLYIRITPALEQFGKASQTLNQYMPCIILFDANIDIGVH